MKGSDTYHKFIGWFVVAERSNQKKAVGILKEITDDGMLLIQGNHVTWLIDPGEIVDFQARPDRFGGGKNGR